MRTKQIEILSTITIGNELVSRAAKENISIDEFNFIEIKEITNKETELKICASAAKECAVVFTSNNAVKAVTKFIKTSPPWKIFCIGNTTKETVSKFFSEESIKGFANNANDLSEKILEDESIKKLIFFCGDKRRDELPEKLAGKGIELQEIIVYSTMLTAKTLTKKYNGILFFSPSGVKSFFLKNVLENDTQVFAIGATTADEIIHFTKQPVYIAEIPGKKNLVELAINYFSKSQII